jgi:hypothetical protein
MSMTFAGADFNWRKGRGSSTTARLGLAHFPDNGFAVRSHRTGAIQSFIRDDATTLENEFFDGEASAYMTPDGRVKVQIWIGE